MSKIIITVDDDDKVSIEHEGCEEDSDILGPLHFALTKEVARAYKVGMDEAMFIISKMTINIIHKLLDEEEE